jgi:peptide/nickel transport system permease protein
VLREGRGLGFRLSLVGWVGVVLAVSCVAVAVVGPALAPHPPDEILGRAYETPSDDYPLGLDYLGRDALSRFLSGGRTALGLAVLATVLGFAMGLPIGLAAAYRRGFLDGVSMRVCDVLLAFPQLIFIMLLIAAFGSSLTLVVIAVAVTHLPRVARIVRAAALEVVDLPYVEAARARGERGSGIAWREILPNVRAPLLVDAGIRLTASIVLVAGVSFLGFGLQPPQADWGLMVSENRAGLTVQPWAVAGPVVAIAFITIGVNLVVDGYQRTARRPSPIAPPH